MPEREDQADVRPIVWSAVALTATVVAVVAGVFGWRAASGDTTQPLQPVAITPQVPALQIAPVDDRRAYEKQQRRLLNSYAWVDGPQRIARIPVERAMQLLSERAQ